MKLRDLACEIDTHTQMRLVVILYTIQTRISPCVHAHANPKKGLAHTKKMIDKHIKYAHNITRHMQGK